MAKEHHLTKYNRIFYLVLFRTKVYLQDSNPEFIQTFPNPHQVFLPVAYIFDLQKNTT